MKTDHTQLQAGTRRRRLTGLALAAVLSLTACGGGGAATGDEDASSGDAAEGPLQEVTLTLNFIAGGPNSGFMLAKAEGFYADAGLDVTIQEGQGSGTTASLVSQGNSDFGYADAPAVMAVRSQGGTLRILAPILQTNGFSVMSLAESNITEIEDLEGKTLAVQPGTAQAALLGAILESNGLSQSDVEVVNIDPSALVGSLLQGQVDAIAAGADSQGVQLQDQGADINQIYFRDAGVPTVGLSIIANDALMDSDPDLVRAFIEASLRGWDLAREDPDAAAAAVADQFPQAGDEEAFRNQLDVDIPLMCAEGAETLGNPPAENWTTTYELLIEYQDLPTTLPIEDYYSTEFLPDSPPAC